MRGGIRVRRDEKGQSLVELAMYLPLLAFFCFACLQFALIFFAQISVMNAARDIGRWAVVHPHTLDTTTIAAIQARLPSGLDDDDMDIAIVPPCTALVAGQCASRPVGATLSITMTYDITDLLFVPAEFSLGPLSIEFPTELPPYTLHMAVEPS